MLTQIKEWIWGKAYQKRTSCVLCGCKEFETVCESTPYPISMSATTAGSSNDSMAPLTVVACKSCECVQLVELIDPVILYKDSHNNTANTPTWKEHHRQFADFILQNIDSKYPVIEIGGADGSLAKHLLSSHKTLQITSLDLCSTHADISGVIYKTGNCETWNYTPDSVVILSHVFEHLYRPAEFVKQIANSGVRSVYLSIPDMNGWLKNDVLSFLHREHTFYCDSEYIL